MDPGIYAVLSFNTSGNLIFKNATSTTLSKGEIIEVESIVKNCIKEYNTEQEKRFNATPPELNLKKRDFLIDLTRYKRQYIPVINEKGEKEVWVNCFCSTTGIDWKQNLVFVFDGGNCYFNLVVNLTKKSYCQLMVNGNA